MTSVIYVFVHH